MATCLGVPMHTVYNWEAGRVRIPKARVQAIANCLETSPRVLVAVLVAGPPAGAAPASDDSPLHLARRAAGLSVAGLAAEVGSSACSVRRWELGRCAPQVRDQATRRCIRDRAQRGRRSGRRARAGRRPHRGVASRPPACCGSSASGPECLRLTSRGHVVAASHRSERGRRDEPCRPCATGPRSNASTPWCQGSWTLRAEDMAPLAQNWTSARDSWLDVADAPWIDAKEKNHARDHRKDHGLPVRGTSDRPRQGA
ncbi:hypothetical protein AERO9AM_20790 [Aeromicrobium sp. 9AM]|nr:hypothetical protein AERO9AM_20790 [Aeromicrobium sp. 9AM]